MAEQMTDAEVARVALAIAGGREGTRTGRLAFLMIRELQARAALVDSFEDIERMELIVRFKMGNPAQLQVRASSLAEDLPDRRQ
jgi:hypothetical protein